jgi:hypothetical protein
MTPTQAGHLMKSARLAARAGNLTHAQFQLFDTMLWSCRAPGSPWCSASYTRLAKLAHMARSMVSGAIRRFEELGLLKRIKRRVRVAWGGVVASRQATNGYVFTPKPTESGDRPADRGQEILTLASMPEIRKESELEMALSRFSAAIIRSG